MTVNKKICCRCVREASLQREISDRGTQSHCSYCGHRACACDLEELADRIDIAFARYYRRTPVEPTSQERSGIPAGLEWRRRGQPVVDAIAQVAQIPRCAAADIRRLLEAGYREEDPGGASEETEFSPEACYEERAGDGDPWREQWFRFEHAIKTQARFFGHDAEELLAGIFADIDSTDRLSSGTHPLVADLGADAYVRHRAFHSYTMKQAVQEGFILDVLAQYTPISSYYKLARTIKDDPEFDSKKAQKKLRRFVEGHEHAIRAKAEIMVDHFHDQLIRQKKISGEARAMVVTNGIERAVQYFHAIRDCLKERKSPFKAIVAFSGEHEFGGKLETEASLNGFPSAKIAERFREHPNRFLVCADKFQTGYDEPLLHTMYVDKTLAGVKAVQTLSRLNRARPDKHDVFVLDFLNDVDIILDAFEPYYRGTVLADETDPNKLHDLVADLDNAQVYSGEQIDSLVSQYLDGADRDRLDPILNDCVAAYIDDLDEDEQVRFKGKAKAFVRTYAFLGCVLPYTNPGWEKRSIFLNFLIPKLPSPEEDDLSRGILEAIDMDSYRVEKRATQKILLADDAREIGPVPTSGVGGRSEAELDPLSAILRDFNDQYGDIEWEDVDRVRDLIAEIVRPRVAEDEAYRNARENSDKENARVEHDRALLRVMTSLMKDDTQLFKLFVDDAGFKRWLTETMFRLTYLDADAA